MNPDPRNVLIVERDDARGLRLRNVLRNCPELKFTYLENALDEALERQRGEVCDIIMLSDAFAPPDIAKFVAQAQDDTAGKVSVFILMCRGRRDKYERPAELIDCIDAVLFEPFGRSELIARVQCARENREERISAVQRRHIEAVLLDVLTYIDACAHRLEIQKRHLMSPRGLTAIKSKMAQIERFNTELYFEVLIEMLIKISNRRRAGDSGAYQGGSRYLRERQRRRELKVALTSGAATDKER